MFRIRHNCSRSLRMRFSHDDEMQWATYSILLLCESMFILVCSVDIARTRFCRMTMRCNGLHILSCISASRRSYLCALLRPHLLRFEGYVSCAGCLDVREDRQCSASGVAARGLYVCVFRMSMRCNGLHICSCISASSPRSYQCALLW